MTQDAATQSSGQQGAVINSATLLMGSTGSGKTSLIVTMIEYVWETYQKVTRVYISDGGGFPTQMQAAINAGIAQVWRMRTRNAPGLAFETCQRASQGWWPSRIKPRTGETEPNVKLVPPITQKFTQHCPNGHIVKIVPFQSLLTAQQCPQCQILVNNVNMKVTVESHVTKGFENIGAMAWDGGTSMSGWMMTDLSHRKDLGGEKGNMAPVESGDLIWTPVNRAGFGFGQNRIEELVHNTLSIPGLVVPPLWTSLTNDSSDDAGLMVRGPAIAPGQAKTGIAPQWFGNCLEIMTETREGTKYRQMRLNEYTDASGMRHLCKTRAYPGELPDVLEDIDTGKSEGEKFVNFNLGKFYKLLADAIAKRESMYTEKYPNAPGAIDGFAEFGEPLVIEQPMTVQPAAARPVPPKPTPRPAGQPAATQPKPSAPPAPAGSTATPAGTSSGTAPVPTPTTPPVVGAPKPAAAAAPAPVKGPALAQPSTAPPAAVKTVSVPVQRSAAPQQAPKPATAPTTAPTTPRPGVVAQPSPAATGPRPASPPQSPGPARGPAAPPGRRPAPPAAPVKP